MVCAIMKNEVLLMCIVAIWPSQCSLVYQRPNLTASMETIERCAVGRLNYSSSEQDSLTIKDFKNHDDSIGLCQVTFVYPKNYSNNCLKKIRLHDIVLRVAYVPKHFQGKLSPWCVVGDLSTACYCSGENCFTDAWSVIVFLLEVYRQGPSDKKRLAYKDALKYFDRVRWDKNIRASVFHCILKEMRRGFNYQHVLPEILTPGDAKVEADWNLFEEKVRNRIASKSKDGDEEETERTEDEDADSEEVTARKIKLKRRFNVVVIIMLVLNVVCLVIIVAFFSWYRDYSRRELQNLGAAPQGGRTSAEDAARKKSSEEDAPKKKSAEDHHKKKPSTGVASSAEAVTGAQAHGEAQPRPPPPPPAHPGDSPAPPPPRRPVDGLDPYFW